MRRAADSAASRLRSGRFGAEAGDRTIAHRPFGLSPIRPGRHRSGDKARVVGFAYVPCQGGTVSVS